MTLHPGSVLRLVRSTHQPTPQPAHRGGLFTFRGDRMVQFRGYTACECLAEWLPVYEAELQRRGILNGRLRIYQLIGGAKASGGTHSTGGAFDLLDMPGDKDVWLARQMGADATWSRRYNWDNRGGMAHMHGVLTG